MSICCHQGNVGLPPTVWSLVQPGVVFIRRVLWTFRSSSFRKRVLFEEDVTSPPNHLTATWAEPHSKLWTPKSKTRLCFVWIQNYWAIYPSTLFNPEAPEAPGGSGSSGAAAEQRCPEPAGRHKVSEQTCVHEPCLSANKPPTQTDRNKRS